MNAEFDLPVIEHPTDAELATLARFLADFDESECKDHELVALEMVRERLNEYLAVRNNSLKLV
ncbi:MAG: hypothetical protein RBT63_08160 [Bdellovibrionales bacterium]|jgi:hypothetical protein|nr:hypothetical protein [Bdellovibrionales bacterium]